MAPRDLYTETEHEEQWFEDHVGWQVDDDEERFRNTCRHDEIEYIRDGQSIVKKLFAGSLCRGRSLGRRTKVAIVIWHSLFLDAEFPSPIDDQSLVVRSDYWWEAKAGSKKGQEAAEMLNSILAMIRQALEKLYPGESWSAKMVSLYDRRPDEYAFDDLAEKCLAQKEDREQWDFICQIWRTIDDLMPLRQVVEIEGGR